MSLSYIIIYYKIKYKHSEQRRIIIGLKYYIIIIILYHYHIRYAIICKHYYLYERMYKQYIVCINLKKLKLKKVKKLAHT